MAINREEVQVRIGLDSTAVDRGMRGVSNTINRSMKQIASSIGGFFAVGTITSALQQVSNKLHDIFVQAKNLDVSTDFLQGIKEVGKDIGPGADKVAASLEILNTKLGDLKRGGEETIKTFEKWGIKATDIAGMNVEQVFFLIADRIKAIPDPAERAAAALDLLGKSGKSMAGMLAEGSEELKKLMAEEHKADAELIRQNEMVRQTLDDTGDAVSIFTGKVAAGLLLLPKVFAIMFTGMQGTKGMMEDAKKEAQKWIDDLNEKVNAALDAEEAVAKSQSEAAAKTASGQTVDQVSTSAKIAKDVMREAKAQGWDPDGVVARQRVLDALKRHQLGVEQALTREYLTQADQQKLQNELVETRNMITEEQTELKKKQKGQGARFSGYMVPMLLGDDILKLQQTAAAGGNRGRIADLVLGKINQAELADSYFGKKDSNFGTQLRKEAGSLIQDYLPDLLKKPEQQQVIKDTRDLMQRLVDMANGKGIKISAENVE